MRSADPAEVGREGRARSLVDLGLFGFAVAVSAYVLLWPTPAGEPPFPYADKIVHAAVFLALAWTGSRVGLPLRGLAISVVAYAVGSEVFQGTLLPHRNGDWTDVVADLVGGVVGLVVARSRGSSSRA